MAPTHPRSAHGCGIAALTSLVMLSACAQQRDASPASSGGDPAQEPSAPQLAINVAANDARTPSPMDATPSPDGELVYFTALSAGPGDGQPGIFRSDADGGEPRELAVGGALAAPVGITISLDGTRLFVADSATAAPGRGGAILALDSAGGTPEALEATRGYRPTGVVIAEVDGEERLYFTGRDREDGKPGVFMTAPGGGQVQLVSSGRPFRDPAGVAVTRDGRVFVVDALASGGRLASVLAVTDEGAEHFVRRIGVGFPAGITLTMDDSTLVVSGLDPTARTDLVYFVDIESQAVATLTEPIDAFSEPAGVHRAHNANVFAWADSEANGSGTVYVLKP